MSTVRSAGNVSGSLKTGFFLTEKGTRMFVVLGIFSVLGSVTKGGVRESEPFYF